MSTLAVIDYGLGNLRSLTHALDRVAGGVRIEVSSDPEALMRADRLVLPGVGGVRACMNELQRLELTDMLREVVGKVPMLGICLGMQVMLEYSEENNGVDALGVFPGEVRLFPAPRVAADGGRRKVPHMGWNRVEQLRPEHPLWRDIEQNSWFYFVHSYHAHRARDEHVFGTTEYGERFTSALIRERVAATQFHPEKSQGAGMQFLANFVNWDGDL